MDNSWYSLEVSPWWVILALVLAVGCSFLLYSKQKMPWGKSMNVFLGFLRLSAIFLIILLLINPLLELSTNETEKPIVVLALDNSESITLRKSGIDTEEITEWVDELEDRLEGQYVVKLELLNGASRDSLVFDQTKTDITRQLKRIKNVYADRNIAAVILASDGIVNSGQSPSYAGFGHPIYSLGLGDTIAPKDLVIQSVKNNRIAYQGNKFPVSVKVYQKGFKGELVEVSISNGKELLTEKRLKLEGKITEASFLIEAKKPGPNRLKVQVEELKEESTFVNNSQDIYIEVIEGKDRVLILAPAPHPDINAIRSVLSSNENYETVVYIPGIYPKPRDNKFDVIIEHQAFTNTQYGDFESGGRWFILGKRSNLAKVGADLNYLTIKGRGGQAQDQVRPTLSESFSKFKLDTELTDRFQSYPPVGAPFGEYKLTGLSEVLLYQQIGNIKTERPLLVFFDNGNDKSAILTGDGFWRWRLQEAASEEMPELFDNMVLKTIQYLSIQTNKERFVARSRKNDYQVGESVYLDIEAYSEIFERTYGNSIAFTLTNEDGEISKYELVDNQANSSLNLGKVPAGIYSFTASVTLGGQPFSKKGSFSVRDVQVETINLTADHNLLRSVAFKSKGAFFHFAERDQLIDTLQAKSFPNVIHTYKDKYPFIQSVWVLLLIVAFLGTEWFFRKYLGAY